MCKGDIFGHVIGQCETDLGIDDKAIEYSVCSVCNGLWWVVEGNGHPRVPSGVCA